LLKEQGKNIAVPAIIAPQQQQNTAQAKYLRIERKTGSISAPSVLEESQRTTSAAT